MWAPFVRTATGGRTDSLGASRSAVQFAPLWIRFIESFQHIHAELGSPFWVLQRSEAEGMSMPSTAGSVYGYGGTMLPSVAAVTAAEDASNQARALQPGPSPLPFTNTRLRTYTRRVDNLAGDNPNPRVALQAVTTPYRHSGPPCTEWCMTYARTCVHVPVQSCPALHSRSSLSATPETLRRGEGAAGDGRRADRQGESE
jgi:hypothetical protein